MIGVEVERDFHIPLANTNTFQHLLREVSFDDAVDLSRAEADTAGVLSCTGQCQNKRLGEAGISIPKRHQHDQGR